MNRHKGSMNKLKIVMIVSGVLTGLQLIPFVMQIVMETYFNFSLKYASAIGIIGAADGPTSIIVVSTAWLLWNSLLRYGFLLICAVTFIVSTVLYFRKRKQSSDD